MLGAPERRGCDMSWPSTLPEWETYIQQLAGEDLRSKAINANTQLFANALLEEGYTLADVEQIILYFVRQLAATGQKIPEDGSYNMVEMAQRDPIAKRGMTMTEEEADALADNPPSEGPDSVDRALSED